MAAPSWSAATSGQPGLASQVNQFLAAHAVTCIYSGQFVSGQTTLGSGAVNTNSLYIAQSFSSSFATTVGRVALYLSHTGSPGPVTVSLYGNSGSAPGTVIASTPLPLDFTGTSAAVVLIPLPATVTPSATYWIVLQAQGDASDYFSWSKSNQVSGASTSSNGTSWTAQGYGLYYEVLDQTTILPLIHTWEDSGNRWTSLSYTSGQLTGLSEYTTGQTAAGYLAVTRALTYTSGDLTGVA